MQELQAEIDGLKSIVDSEGQKSHSQLLELNKIKDDIAKNSLAVENFDKRINEILSNQELMVKSSNENNESIKKVIKELTEIINKINKEYVTKELFEKLAQDNINDLKKLDENYINDFEVLKKEIEKLAKEIKDIKMTSSKSPNELMKDAEDLYNAKKYKEAKVIYEKLVELNHKPARCTFYLAEIEYNNKSYSKALDMYKKSVALYDKAEYMPELLYHSGISCMNLKDNKNAVNFLETYVNSFPNHEEVAKAKKLLSSLKDKK